MSAALSSAQHAKAREIAQKSIDSGMIYRPQEKDVYLMSQALIELQDDVALLRPVVEAAREVDAVVDADHASGWPPLERLADALAATPPRPASEPPQTDSGGETP